MSLTKVSNSMITGAVVNVLDYGAIGNGIADDTVAINAAIAAAPEYSTLTLGTGLYRITSTLVIEKSLSICGTGVESGFILDVTATTNGIVYGKLAYEVINPGLNECHSTWNDFGIYGNTTTAGKALVLCGVLQCDFINIHVMAKSTWGIWCSMLQSCRRLEFNSNQFYRRYPHIGGVTIATIPTNGFRVSKLDGTATVVIDCGITLNVEGMTYGALCIGLFSSTIKGLVEGCSTRAIELRNSQNNHIQDLYLETVDSQINLAITNNSNYNTIGPGIFQSGIGQSIRVDASIGTVIKGNVLNAPIAILSDAINTVITDCWTTGQTSSDILDSGKNTTQVVGQSGGYLDVNQCGAFSDFNSITINGSFERWIDVNTPEGSVDAVGCTFTRETTIVKHGIASCKVVTSVADSPNANAARWLIPSPTPAVNLGVVLPYNKMTLTGWVYIPTVGGADVGTSLYWDGGALTTMACSTITTRDAWVKFTVSVPITAYTYAYTTVSLRIYTAGAAGTFYLDGLSAVPGSSGGAIAYTPNAYEFPTYTGTSTWDPGSIGAGTFEARNFSVLGAGFGMTAQAAAGVDVLDLVVSATVTAANVVTVVLYNPTGGSIDLGSSTWKVLCTKI